MATLMEKDVLIEKIAKSFCTDMQKTGKSNNGQS